MAARVFFLHDFKEETEEFGEKVKNLLHLINHGFEVAQSFVITHQAYLDFLKENNLNKKVEHLVSSGAQKHVDKHIDQAQLPDGLIKEILREYKKFGTVLEDVEINLNGEKIKGEASLIEKIRQIFVSNFKNNNSHPLIVQKIHFGKNGKLRTSSKFINTIHPLSPEEILKIEKFVDEFKKLFFLPHEIEFTIEKGKVLISKIKQEPNTAINGISQETHYKIINNSAF